MPDLYKLQYNGNTITFPGFNGFLNYKPDYRLFVHYPFANTGIFLSTPTELTNLSGKVSAFNFECQGYNAQPDSYQIALFSGYPGEIIEDMESHLITSGTYENQTGEFARGVLYVPDDYAEKVKIGVSSLFLSFARGGRTMFMIGNTSAFGYETVLDYEPSIRNITYTLNGYGEGYMPNSAVPGEIIPLMFGNGTATVEGANTASYTYATSSTKGYEVADSDINVTVTFPKFYIQATDANTYMSAKITTPTNDTVNLTADFSNTNKVESYIPLNSTATWTISSKPYYRMKNNRSSLTGTHTAYNTSDTHCVTGSAIYTAPGQYITANSDKYYAIFNCNMHSKTTAYSKITAARNASGGIWYMDIKPTACNISSNITGVPTASLTSTTNNPYITYCSSFSTASKITASTTAQIGSNAVTYYTPNFSTYNLSAGYVSGYIAVTGRSRHTTGSWTGTGSTGANEAIYLRCLSASTANATGWGAYSYNNKFFVPGGTGSVKTHTTSFKPAYSLPVCTRTWLMNIGCGLGVPSNGASTTYTRLCPPNQIMEATGTMVVSGLIK